MESRVDFGSFFGEFVQEFDCDATKLEQVSIMLTKNFDILREDSNQQIQKYYRKVSKKFPEFAAKISSLFDDIANSELCNGKELIAFFIYFAKAGTSKRREQKKARLAILNQAPSTVIGSSRSTPKNYSSAPSTFSVKTNSSRVRFLDMEVSRTPVLNGRAESQAVVDENIIMADILSALVGLEGRYIVLVDQYSFGISSQCAIDDVLHSRLLNVLKICSLYKSLQRLTLCSSSDLMTQAFYGSIPEVLIEYSQIISAQYSKFTNCSSCISPLEISLELDDWQLIMQQFICVSKKCSEKWRGMKIVNLIFGLYCRCAIGSLEKRVLKTTLKAMLSLFHRSMSQWLLYGTLDESVEWMITCKRKEDSNNPWSTKYEIVNAAVPEIFKNFSEITKKILMIGQSVALLNSLGIKDHYFAERKRLLESLDSLHIYLSVQETSKFFAMINRMYKRTNAEVMVEVVGNYLIRDHLDAVQKHFFLTDGCFAQCFFQQLSDVANDDLIKLDSNHACHAFTEAVSACSSFPAVLKKHGHFEATCEIMGKNIEVISGTLDEKSYPIRLSYITKAPVSIVLNEGSLDHYKKIFEFIWQIVSVDFRLSEIIEIHGRLCVDVLPKWEEMIRICRLFSAIFVRMAYYLNIVRSYINTIIERCSKKFASQFDSPSCGDLAKLVDYHRFFLASIGEQLFLDDNGKAVRTAVIATLDAIKDGILEYRMFESKMRALFASGASEIFSAGDPIFCKMDETEVFEFEEKRVELRAEFDKLLEIYKPSAKTYYARFVLLVSNVSSSLADMNKSPPCLLLQHLRFGKFC